jgi:radical SAM superfamily enzyme YgiQ (UPF0313 family)
VRILLVKPKWFVEDGVYRFLTHVTFQPLHLGILAALSPGHDVTVVDQDWDGVPFDGAFDLVGITATSYSSQRAFDIADAFRRRGVPVVLGGVHACLMPEECLQHADAIVIGEAEYVWPQVLLDVAADRLHRTYRQDRPTDMEDVPIPRRDLLRQELAGMRQEVVFFVDDNLFTDPEYAIELCDTIAPLKKAWSVQAPTDVVKNERLLEAMQRSGCFFVQVGFQTVHPDSLQRAGVAQNRIESYREVVRAFHRHGMLVQGFFIFGFDNEDTRIFSTAEAHIRQMGLDDALLYILTPYPGTPIYDQLKREGRLLVHERDKYGWANAVFEPARMSAEELESGVQETYERLFRFFRTRAPRRILRWLPLFVRHPGLFKLVVEALNRKVRIRPSPRVAPARAA